MLLNSAIFFIFFFGGWLIPDFLGFFQFYEIFYFLFFNIKVIFVAILFIIVRAILPRYRFDQLMDLC